MIYLTVDNHRAMEALLARVDVQPIVRAAIRRKLSRARLVFPEDVSARTVTLNSRVNFRLGEEEAECRTLVTDERFYTPGIALPVTTPMGIALLGLSEGDRTTVRQPDGDAYQIETISIAYQPERARNGASWKDRSDVVVDLRAHSTRRPHRPDESRDPDPTAA
ncbi:MAG: GreA/GreB family elongation factor [Pseudorhodoplanes sp.]